MWSENVKNHSPLPRKSEIACEIAYFEGNPCT